MLCETWRVGILDWLEAASGDLQFCPVLPGNLLTSGRDAGACCG